MSITQQLWPVRTVYPAQSPLPAMPANPDLFMVYQAFPQDNTSFEEKEQKLWLTTLDIACLTQWLAMTERLIIIIFLAFYKLKSSLHPFIKCKPLLPITWLQPLL